MLSPELTQNHSPAITYASVGLALWFALVFLLGANGAFVRAPATVPLPILIGVTAPIIAFLITYGFSPAFRDFVLSLDLRLVTGFRLGASRGLAFWLFTLTACCRAISPGLLELAISRSA